MPSTHSSQESSSSSNLVSSSVVVHDKQQNTKGNETKMNSNDVTYSHFTSTSIPHECNHHQVINERDSASITQQDDDTVSVISAATTSTSSATSPKTKRPPRRVGCLLIVEKVVAETSARSQLERIVSSFHVIAGVSHTGNVEFPAGGFDPRSDKSSLLRGAVREASEELKHSVLLHLPRRDDKRCLPAIKSDIPSLGQIANNDDDDDDCQTQHHHSIAVAHSDDIFESISEQQQLASIEFECNYGRGDAGNRPVTLFLCRYLDAAAASPFDLGKLQQVFDNTHVPVDDSVAWCEFKELKLIPIFAAAKTVTSVSDIQLSDEFLHCCFAHETDANCPNLAEKKQSVLSQLLAWFVAAPSSSSDEVEREPTTSTSTTISKTQAKKLKNLQRENLRQALVKPILDDSNLQIASSFLRFSVRPSPRRLQKREMCSLCYSRAFDSAAESSCPIASRQYAHLKLEKALRLKNGAILLKWKIVPPPSASGSKTVIPNSNLVGRLTRFCQGNEWVDHTYKLANDFTSIASSTPGGDDLFEQYITSDVDSSSSSSTLPPLYAEGIPEVSEVLNEKTLVHGYNRSVLVTKVFLPSPPPPPLYENNRAALLPPPPRSYQQHQRENNNNNVFARQQIHHNNNNNNDRFNFRNAATGAAAASSDTKAPQRSFFGANTHNRN